MASRPDAPLRTGSTGRGFASIDPERQGEVPGRLIRTTTSEGWSPQRTRPAVPEWMRVAPEQAGSFEGGSGRRSH